MAAARDLVARGGAAPTVEEAAAAASISRTTAYRYFPNQKALLRAAHPEMETTTLIGPDASDDPEARLKSAVGAFTRLIAETEHQQRTMLRLSLDPDVEPADLPLRKGRAIGWFEDALSPLEGQLAETEIHRLAVAIRSAVGIESLVWLTDVAGLSREEAAELMQWSALAMFHHALAMVEKPPPHGGDRDARPRGARTPPDRGGDMVNESGEAREDLPKIGAPATRALAAIGVTTLDGVARHTAAELLALHGVGPKAIRILGDEMASRGLGFRE